jgi:hypothetical protein
VRLPRAANPFYAMTIVGAFRAAGVFRRAVPANGVSSVDGDLGQGNREGAALYRAVQDCLENQWPDVRMV